MKEVKEKCGVFGVYGNPDAVNLTYRGLININNRGHDSAGMADKYGNRITGSGYASDALTDGKRSQLKGEVAIGHVRYATSRVFGHDHHQPVQRYIKDGESLYLSHNGNIPSTKCLERLLDSQGVDPSPFNDTELIAEAMVPFLRQGASVEEAFWEVKEKSGIKGAFTLLGFYRDKMTMIKDMCGLKPGGYSLLEEGIAFSSESSGLMGVDIRSWVELGAGQSITVDREGLRDPVQLYIPERKFDIWELIYFMRKSSYIDGILVGDFRYQLGRNLAKEHPSSADMAIPIMDSGEDAAIGYTEESGIPLEYVLKKRNGVGRSFISLGQQSREQMVRNKFEEIPQGSLKGKKVETIDDSQVRGTTSPIINEMLYAAGVEEVHNKYASPPYMYPDFYGTDTPRQLELIASRLSIEEIREATGCKSIGYLSMEGLIRTIAETTGFSPSMYNFSCLTGKYPIDIGERAKEIIYPQRELASV